MITTELSKELVMYIELELQVKNDIKMSKYQLERAQNYAALEIVRGFIFKLFEDLINEDKLWFVNLTASN